VGTPPTARDPSRVSVRERGDLKCAFSNSPRVQQNAMQARSLIAMVVNLHKGYLIIRANKYTDHQT
jgi:hypothetical protein